jgi:hypothetical protein
MGPEHEKDELVQGVGRQVAENVVILNKKNYTQLVVSGGLRQQLLASAEGRWPSAILCVLNLNEKR